ncbi:MAG TPA: glycoside hydrolase family 3 N-terminal domain-containing protein, partial [Roseiarcus sp.]|nr:glycoside hydrolase family 3 N-terminal domain-containing protein [Roseiarcus sp.]
MSCRLRLVAIVAALATMAATAGEGGGLDPAERARATLERMTEAEKLALVHGGLAARWGKEPKPTGAIGSAGFVPGVPRLGVPALQETDAELGVANPGNIRRGDLATAMPSNLALASTWDPALARRQGEAVGSEAQARGFNVLLGGTANLIRDPRGGRNFEYFSEDPLLTGIMAGAAIAGAQSRRGLISTIKHFALNDQETDRVVLDVRIDRAAARE